MKKGASSAAPLAGQGHQRLQRALLMALHVGAAVGLGWVAVNAGCGVLAALLARAGMAPSDAVMVAQMAACIAYPLLVVWAYAGRRPLRVAAEVAGAALALHLLAWALGT